MEGSKTSFEIFTEDKELHAHIQKIERLEIIGYSHSDFSGCIDSRKSTSGYIYLLAGGAISWKSVKKVLITSFTMAAEYIACYEASNHGN